MAFGFGFLRLEPSSFWQMSLQEFHAAISYSMPEIDNPITSSALAELMRLHPDN